MARKKRTIKSTAQDITDRADPSHAERTLGAGVGGAVGGLAGSVVGGPAGAAVGAAVGASVGVLVVERIGQPGSIAQDAQARAAAKRAKEASGQRVATEVATVEIAQKQLSDERVGKS